MSACWKVEAGGSQVQGQLGLHGETLSQKENSRTCALEVYTSVLERMLSMYMILGSIPKLT